MRTILVIEDDEDVRDNVLDLLKGEGFFALGAENGEEGLVAAQKRQPDLIVCDIMMPGMDGFEVLKNIREAPSTSAIPFIFLTARAARSDFREGMELGADDYLAKPFTAMELLNAVQTRLKKYDVQGHWYQERLGDLRNNLSRTLPHELRTPLSSILGYSQFLLEIYDSVKPEELRDMIQEVYSAGQRLERLIENYHLYAQLEMAATDPARRTSMLNLGTSHVEKVTAKVAKDVGRDVGRSEDLQVQVAAGAVRIQSIYLEKIMEELIRNAFKFSQEGMPVRVEGVLEGEHYVLTIIDRGRGMDPAYLSQVGAFVQFDRDKYEQQGLGLGLTLVRRLAELHQGILSMERTPGQGLTVRVKLPLAGA